MRAAASAAVFLHAVTAARVEVELHGNRGPDDSEQIVPVTVCEDVSIWDQVMASPDVDAIRAIPWKDISNSIDGYLEQEVVLVSNLEKVIENLELEIKKRKDAEASQELSDDQIQTLITQTVEQQASFKTLQDAISSGCGKPGRQPRLSPRAHQAAVDKMPDFARPLLSTGEYKSVKSEFMRVCKQFLQAGNNELENYCGQLCVELADVVQGISDQHSNSVKSTVELEKKLSEQNAALLAAKTRQQQCEKSKNSIGSFHEYLDSLDADIKSRHEAMRAAEYELAEAQWALDDLLKALEEQKKSVQGAMSLLEGDEENVVEAKEALDGLGKDIDVIMKQIEKTKRWLDQLREKLAQMKKANEVILEIKKYVTATTMKMGYYVDMAVREPVREIGLVEETDVWDYFKKEVSQEQCAKTFKLKLKDFHEYCTGPAMTAFEQIKHIVDLTPLCQLGEEEDIADEEERSVQNRINLLTADLQNVQSWLDPFRGTHMTKDKEQQKVKEGEPEGLRHIQGVFSQGDFYTGYLAEWKFSKGKFHALLAELRKATQALETQIVEGDVLVNNTTGQLEKLGQQQELAQEKLRDATAQRDAALTKKEGLEEAQRLLESDVANSKQLLIDLEAALKLAKQAYLDAKDKLVEEHANRKVGVFAMSQLHERDLLGM